MLMGAGGKFAKPDPRDRPTRSATACLQAYFILLLGIPHYYSVEEKFGVSAN